MSGIRSHGSAPGSDCRTMSSISSPSPASRAEKLKLSDLEGLELSIIPNGVLSKSADEGDTSDIHGDGPGSSKSSSQDSGVCSLNVSRLGWSTCSSALGVVSCGNRRSFGFEGDFLPPALVDGVFAGDADCSEAGGGGGTSAFAFLDDTDGGTTTVQTCPINPQKPGNYRIILPFFPRAAVLLATLVSSNGRHLKSFLYPPHGTLRRSHCRQDGLDSSHFRRLALQVEQPGWAKKTVGREGQRPAHSFMIVGDKWQPRVSPLSSPLSPLFSTTSPLFFMCFIITGT